MYRLEMHAHAAPVSKCAKASAECALNRYREAEYHGIVLSNHVNKATFRDMTELSWEDKARYFIREYEEFKKKAGSDFTVLFGAEVNLTPENAEEYIPNDYLIYGLTPEWFVQAGDPRFISLQELSDRVRKAGFLLVQAHPFRYKTVIMDDKLLDGVEVYNANAGHDSHNYLTELWAEKKHLIRTTGSDFHNPVDVPSCGIMTEEPVEDNETLMKVLRSGNYQLSYPEGH